MDFAEVTNDSHEEGLTIIIGSMLSPPNGLSLAPCQTSAIEKPISTF